MLTGQTNFSSRHVSFLTVQNIENTYFEEFPMKPKISPHMHKKALLKSINVLIVKSIT